MAVGCCEYFYDYDMIFWVAIDVYQIMLKRVLLRFGEGLRSFRSLRLRGKKIDLMKGLSRWGGLYFMEGIDWYPLVSMVHGGSRF